MSGFTHIDKNGNASMVDVSAKNETQRFARASGKITVSQAVMDAINSVETSTSHTLWFIQAVVPH